MSDDADMTDWQQGQSPPWLDAYGPPPVDDSYAATAGPPAAREQTPQDVGAAPAPASTPPIDAALAGMPAAPPAAAPPAVAPKPAESPDQTRARIAVDPNASLADRQQAFAGLSPKQRTELVNNGDPQQLAAIATSTMSPEDLAMLSVRHQQAQIHEQSAQQLDLARKTDEEARANFQAHQAAVQRANAATDQLSAEAFALSQQKIDPKEHGVGHFIASVLTSALGGAMSQYSGGRNLALEELDRGTQQRIDAQKADLANQWQGVSFRRNLIGEQVQRSGDLYRAQEAYRISTYDRATSELQTKMQDYDPQGTTALRGAGVIQQLQAQRQQALIAFNQQQFKNTMDDLKEKREGGAQQEIARHNKAQEGIEYAKIADARAARGQLTPEQLEKMQGRVIGGVVTGVDQNGAVKRGPLTMADGSTPFIAKSEDEAKALKKSAPAVNEVNRLANQMARDIADLGALDKSSTLATDKHQQLMADKEQLIFKLHQAEGIEGFRPGTAEMLEKLLGGVDPDKWGRDATAGILRAKDNVNSDFTAQLHVAGWDGQRYEPADTSKPAKPVDSPAEERMRDLISGEGGVREGNGIVGLSNDQSRHLMALANEAFDLPGRAGLKSVDPDTQARAGDALVRIAKESKSPAVRAEATRLLQEAANPDTSPTPDTGLRPTTSVAHEGD